MAKQTHLKVGGVWKPVKSVWRKVAGVWESEVMTYRNISSVWKTCMSYLTYIVETFAAFPTTIIETFVNTYTTGAQVTTIDANSGLLRIYTDSTANNTWTARALATKSVNSLDAGDIEVSVYIEPSSVATVSTYNHEGWLWLMFGDYNPVADVYTNVEWVRLGYIVSSSRSNGEVSAYTKVNGGTVVQLTLSNHPTSITTVDALKGTYKIKLTSTTLKLYHNDVEVYSGSNPFGRKNFRIVMSGAQNHTTERINYFDNLSYLQKALLTIPTTSGKFLFDYSLYEEQWELNNAALTPVSVKEVDGMKITCDAAGERAMWVTSQAVDLTGINSVKVITTGNNLTGENTSAGRWIEIRVTNDKTGDTYTTRVSFSTTALTTTTLSVSALSGNYHIAMLLRHASSATGTSWAKLHKAWLE